MYANKWGRQNHNENEDPLKNKTCPTPEVTKELLEKYEQTINKVSELLNNPSIAQDPTKIDIHLRAFLNKEKTLEAKLKYVQDELSQFKTVFSSADEAIEAKRKAEDLMKQNKIKANEIDKENTKLKIQIDALKADLPETSTISDAIHESEANISKARQNLKEKENERNKLRDQIKEIQNRIKAEEDKTIELNRKVLELRNDMKSSETFELSNKLDELQKKNANMQKVYDNLLSETAQKSNAQRIVMETKIREIKEKLQEIEKQKKIAKEEFVRVEKINQDIFRLSALISREEKKKTEPELPVPEKKELNKARVSRLVALLLTKGAKPDIIKSLAQELEWTKEQTESFTKIAHGQKEKGIGEIWTDWLVQAADEN